MNSRKTINGQRRKSQGRTAPKRSSNPPEELEGEPRVDLGEEDMNLEAMKNPIATMQVEMNNLRSNQENVSQNFVLQ